MGTGEARAASLDRLDVEFDGAFRAFSASRAAVRSASFVSIVVSYKSRLSRQHEQARTSIYQIIIDLFDRLAFFERSHVLVTP